MCLRIHQYIIIRLLKAPFGQRQKSRIATTEWNEVETCHSLRQYKYCSYSDLSLPSILENSLTQLIEDDTPGFSYSFNYAFSEFVRVRRKISKKKTETQIADRRDMGRIESELINSHSAVRSGLFTRLAAIIYLLIISNQSIVRGRWSREQYCPFNAIWLINASDWHPTANQRSLTIRKETKF